MIWDTAIVGAGAAGLMTAITAKRAGLGSVLLLDSKEKIGAKILMSGGTRCNLTNEMISVNDYCTHQTNILKSVLQFFSSSKAIDFFKELGVQVVLEPGGKFFPSTHSAKSVLEALQREVERLGIVLETPRKVTAVRPRNDKMLFQIDGEGFTYTSKTAVLTTGGLSYPGTGSDGAGYEIAKSFGHTIIETTPALTPLLTEDQDFQSLAGITLPVRLTLWVNKKKEIEIQDSFLFTHSGFSGPAVLDMSRHWIHESDSHHDLPVRQAGHGDCHFVLTAHFLPGFSQETFHKKFMQEIQYHPERQVQTFLCQSIPPRLAEVLIRKAGIVPDMILNQLPKQQREKLMSLLFHCPLEITRAYGYQKAEVTAGGVDLAEVSRRSLESKKQPGLFFAGEILDVDGRIGGFNFQWAWSSGVVAGLGVAEKTAVCRQ